MIIQLSTGSSQEERDTLLTKASAGDPIALFRLANYYIFKEHNEREGVVWLRRSADAGYSYAQYDLAVLLSLREDSVSQKEAVKWYEKAAFSGITASRIGLAKSYEDGKGVAKDYGKAFEQYEMAAYEGDTTGIKNLVEYYYSGLGVTRSIVKAYVWSMIYTTRVHPDSSGGKENSQKQDAMSSKMDMSDLLDAIREYRQLLWIVDRKCPE